jgi:hypothetical protein
LIEQGRFHATDSNHSSSDHRRLGRRVDTQIQEPEDLKKKADFGKLGGGPVEFDPRIFALLVDAHRDCR